MNPLLKFKTHDGWWDGADETSLQGGITCDYKRLVRVFGQPSDGDGYKTDAEWNIEFADGMAATIYNWKNGPNYKGSNGIPVEENTNWNVGGHYARVVPRIRELLALDFVEELNNDFKEIKSGSGSVESKISKMYATLDKMYDW